MKLLQVITDTDRRGSQQFAADLAPALERRGWAVATAALAPGRSAHRLPVETLGRTRRSHRTLAALRALMRQAEVVIAHGSTTLPACAIAGLGLPTPFVYRSIGDPLYWSSSAGRRLRTRVFLRRAAAVTALWPAAGEALQRRLGVGGRPLRILPNAVPEDRCPLATGERRRRGRDRLGLDPDSPVALFVGALAPEKDVATLISAVAALDGWRLVLVGDGPLREEVRDMATARAPGRVLLAGVSDDVPGLLPAADVVCLPSLSEGQPGILIEAGLAGVPAVATDVGGVGEIVTPATGRLVPPRDPEAFAAALAAVHADRVALGAAARRRCLDRFEIEPVADGWDDLLRSLLPRQ